MTFDVDDLHERFLLTTNGNQVAAAQLAHAETLRYLVEEGPLEVAVRSAVNSAFFYDEKESLFDVFFEVAERFLKPLPLEKTLPEKTNPENKKIQSAP